MIPLAPIFAIARGVPWWAWALAALLAWGGWHRWRAMDAREDFAAAQVQAQAERDVAERAATTETQRRTKTIMEAADAATIQSANDRAAADDARSALERVRRQLAADQAQRRAADPAASTSGASAGAADVVPAELLGRCGQRVLELAAYADASRTAGTACERSYDSLTASP